MLSVPLGLQIECSDLFLPQSRQDCRGGSVVKNPPANEGDIGDRRLGFSPWVGKIPWRRAWQPTPVFLSGESHGQRSLAGYSQGVAKTQTRLKGLSRHVQQTGVSIPLRSLFGLELPTLGASGGVACKFQLVFFPSFLLYFLLPPSFLSFSFLPFFPSFLSFLLSFGFQLSCGCS